MKLDITNLIRAPFGQKESFNVEFFNEEIDEDVLAERTKGEITLTRLDEEILASFKGVTKLALVCDRCLGKYDFELPLDFSQEYLFARADADLEKLAIESDNSIDITEPIRQEIIAGLPVKKLCTPDCRGICPSCGQNLNESKCRCKVAEKKE